MIIFDKNELEIAIVTYNRAQFVKVLLEKCFNDFFCRNIQLSIYDSSTNDETKKILENIDKYRYIKYHKIDSDIEIGYKPMLPILNTTSKYLWVAGDSKYFDINDLDNTIFRYIKNNDDFIIISAGPNNNINGTLYKDKSKFIYDCFLSSTCIGHSIYKMSIFNKLQDKNFIKKLDDKYRHNYGFAWLGYFYECFALNNNNARFVNIKPILILSKIKKQAWATRFYECWVENLIDICDKIPDLYISKNNIPKSVWKLMVLDNIEYCRRARIAGGLDVDIYNKYHNTGMLKLVGANQFKMFLFAIVPCFVIDVLYYIYKVKNKICSLIKKIVWRE